MTAHSMSARSMSARSMSARTMSARTMASRALDAPSVGQNWDSLQFKLIFSLCLAFYLTAAVLARLDPRSWRRARLRRSAFAEAWEASGTTARIAFSG